MTEAPYFSTPRPTSMCPNNSAMLDVYESQEWTEFHSNFLPERSLMHLLLLWISIGVPGSLLSLVVWSRKRLRHSSSVYLSALAVTDLSVLVLAIPYYLQRAFSLGTLDVPVWCKLFPALYIWAQYACILLTLAFTVERYISVCRPFAAERLCTMARARWTTLALLGGCALAASAQLLVHCYDSKRKLCDACPLLTTPIGIRAWDIWVWCSELTVFGLVPLSILAFNLRVILELRRLSKREQAIGGRSNSSSRGSAKASTITLLSVSFALIAGSLPVSFVLMLTSNFPEGSFCMALDQVLNDQIWRRYLSFQLAKSIIYNFCSAHYAINGYIYLLTGTAFRQEALHLLCGHWRSRDRLPVSAMTPSRSEKSRNGTTTTTYV